MAEIIRHVDGVLVRQSTALTERGIEAISDRHVVLDEGGGGIGSRHAGADVERLVAPERGKDIIAVCVFEALAVLAVAGGAFGFVDLLAARWIGNEIGVNFANTGTGDLGVARKPG